VRVPEGDGRADGARCVWPKGGAACHVPCGTLWCCVNPTMHFIILTVHLQLDPAEPIRNVSPAGEIELKWGEMVRGVGAFTTPVSTMAEHREWLLGSTSAATSPCSMKDRDGGGRRREREAQAHLHACKRMRIPPVLALPTGADL